MAGDERRRDQRIDKAVPVRLQFQGTDDFLRAYTENISLGGVFVPTATAVPQGTRVALTIELQPGKGMQVTAEVTWRRDATPGRPAGVGLRFVEMKPQLETWLHDAVAKYAAEHAPAETTLAAEPMLRKAVIGRVLPAAQVEVSALALQSDDGGLVIGIDLGTSNSCACVWRDGKAEILELDDSGTERTRTIPSVVAYDGQGAAVVGSRALDGLSKNAKRTIYGSKRFIGRQYDHPEVQAMLTRYPYKVVPGPEGKAAVDINDRPLSFTAVSAKILAHIRDKAQEALRSPVSRAIITVPAFYNQNQRHAVTQAGRLAGLAVERIVNEPTAAAIAYGISLGKACTILVYDLGGGTFDVSAMRVSGETLEVLSTAGDTFLGGEDFDNAIVGWVADTFHKQHGKHLSRNHAALAPLKIAAERAKKRLTLHTKAMVTAREVALSDGSTQRLELELERDTFERLVEPLVERTLKICDMALQEAKLTADAVDDVILVGGQTLMPYVQRKVAERFGKAPRYDLAPDEVVALGAGMLTHMHRNQAGPTLRDVLSMSIGIGLGGGRFKKLIERNTPLPARVGHHIQVPRRDLPTYTLEIYQGEAPEVPRNEHLGTLSLAGLTPGPQDPVPLDVELMLSPDCLLKVRVYNRATEQDVDVLLDTRDVG